MELKYGPEILVNIVNVSVMAKGFVLFRIVLLHNQVANLPRDFVALLNVLN